jgi:prepilin-type N-terminal cleavage/methylation domain-containing protein
MFRDKRGFTLTELLIVVAILMLTSGFILVQVNPGEAAKRNRDGKRLIDLSLLSQAIEDFAQDNALSYPDQGARVAVRRSNALPSGNSGPVMLKNGQGWIDADFGDRMEKLPTDSLNTNCNVYRYGISSNGLYYKLDTVLEYYTSKMASDGGEDNSHYEVGNTTAVGQVVLGSCP